jgi:hypothetical protein
MFEGLVPPDETKTGPGLLAFSILGNPFRTANVTQRSAPREAAGLAA